ncbi:MAG: glycoside hydrolase family protein [Clostridium sp.]|nr:glycoside hydrolase family protein [Clostridium sp.]
MRKPITTWLLPLLALICSVATLRAGETNAIEAGQDYYLYHLNYGKLLGVKADGTPALSAGGAADSYIFSTEASGESGYYLLRQKGSGKYLAASTGNSYSVQFLSAAPSGNAARWALRGGDYGSLSSRRSPSLYLGCDDGKDNDEYVGVYYDKALTAFSQWLIIRAEGSFETSLHAFAMRELQTAVNEGDEMCGQESYSVLVRRRIQTAVDKARAVAETAASADAATLLAASRTLRTTLTDYRTSAAELILTGTDFDMDNTYTLRLSGVRFATATETSTMLLRDKSGRGLQMELGPQTVTVGGHTYAVPASADEAGADYTLMVNGGNATVSCGDTKIADVPFESVLPFTTAGTACEWSLLRTGALSAYMAEVVSPSAIVQPGQKVTDSYGNTVRYIVCMSGQNLRLTEAVDFHIMRETGAVNSSVIDLVHEKAWVIFDNTLPSDVGTSMLKSIRINGSQAVRGVNARADVYLNGAVVMPFSADVKPFAGYTGEAYSGEAVEVGLGANNLGADCNRIRSFILKRGYMATVASGADGTGYSRVYVADHEDLLVPVLPQALNRRISSVHVKQWNYVSKKGWCSTTSNSSIAAECKKVRATWFYTWSADRSSTADTEYIPIRQHLYWPSLAQVNGHENSTHVLSFNEPEHAEQHTSDKCSCGGVISEWTACTKTPDLLASGSRIGSPAPTDAGWLGNYIGHCNDMSYRCDFVVMHCYWGTNEAPNAASWYSQLKAIYDKTKRPIWITEWNNGASWTTEWWPSGYSEKLEKNRKAIQEILNVLDTCSFVERYAFYNWDSYYRAAINTDDGSLLPAGVVYRDNKSTFAYNAAVQFVPIWWAPSLKDVDMRSRIRAAEGVMDFDITNPNGDVTDRMVIQRRLADGTYEDFHELTDRAMLDSTAYTVSLPLSLFNLEEDELRLMVTTSMGKTAYSTGVSVGYLANPNIVTSTKTAVDGWVCQRSAANGYTKATGDTYFEVWDASTVGEHFDYYQDVTELPEGVYELSAACFNTTDGVKGATVNGHVGLYAESAGYEYFAPVTEDGELDLSRRQTISRIAVTDGALRVGVKNIGPMSARWAGADAFRLRYVGTLAEALPEGTAAFLRQVRDEADERRRALFGPEATDGTADASALIINADCDRSDSYGWTASGVEYAKGEGYDGSVTNPYWNRWSGSSYTSTLAQTIRHLPAGYYTVSALTRGSEGLAMTLSAEVEHEGAVKTVDMSTPGTGLELPAGSDYVKGWRRYALPEVRVAAGDVLTLRFMAANASGAAWWSADHFGLTFRPDPFTGVSSAKGEATDDDLSVVACEGGLRITASRTVRFTVHTPSGVLVADMQVKPGITVLPLRPGLYIAGGRKVAVR